ncbi:hypothetical protein ACM66B_006821 [Microbotryomycetes sp. NB124-2]
MSSDESSRGNSPALNESHVAQQANDDDGAPRPDNGADSVAQDDNELDTSFFPAPAHYYKRYTDANVSIKDKDAVIDAQQGGASVLRRDLDPPDVDDIIKHGSYSVFGDTWPVEEQLPSLADMGVREMFDKGHERSQSLSTLLRAMLVTYTQLVSSLLQPPPSLEATERYMAQHDGQEPPTDPERFVEHIRLISINMHHLVNELRPVQARETLKNMMRQQIERRRAKTAAIKQRCADLSTALAALKAEVGNEADTPPEDLTQPITRNHAPVAQSSDGEEAWQRLIEIADDAAANSNMSVDA